MGFQKGQSGNPSGRPKGAVAATTRMREQCEKYGDEIVDYLVAVMRNGENETSERTAAAKILLEYGYGKPKQQVDLTDGEGGPAKIIVEVITK